MSDLGPEDRLRELRDRIIEVDREIVRIIHERRDLVVEVGRIKEEMGLPVTDPRREAEVVRRAAGMAREMGVDEELTRDVIWRIIAAARELQEGQKGWGPPPRPEWMKAPDGDSHPGPGSVTAPGGTDDSGVTAPGTKRPDPTAGDTPN